MAVATDTGSSWSDVIQAFTSVVNLIVVGYIFLRERKEEQSKQTKIDRRELVSFRIRNLVLERYMPLVHDYCDVCDVISREIKAMEVDGFDASKLNQFKAGHIKKYKRLNADINNRVIQALICISDEFKALSKLLSDHEDLITESLDGIVLDDAGSRQGFDSAKLRNGFLRELLNAESRALECISTVGYNAGH